MNVVRGGSTVVSLKWSGSNRSRGFTAGLIGRTGIRRTTGADRQKVECEVVLKPWSEAHGWLTNFIELLSNRRTNGSTSGYGHMLLGTARLRAKLIEVVLGNLCFLKLIPFEVDLELHNVFQGLWMTLLKKSLYEVFNVDGD